MKDFFTKELKWWQVAVIGFVIGLVVPVIEGVLLYIALMLLLVALYRKFKNEKSSKSGQE